MDFVRVTIRQWRLLGLISTETEFKRKSFYKIYQIIFYLILVHLCILTMLINALVISIGSLQQLIENWYILLTVLNMLGK